MQQGLLRVARIKGASGTEPRCLPAGSKVLIIQGVKDIKYVPVLSVWPDTASQTLLDEIKEVTLSHIADLSSPPFPGSNQGSESSTYADGASTMQREIGAASTLARTG